MTISDRAEQAVVMKNSGCNCCQAVLAALRDQTGLSEDQALTLASGFGGGMGSMEGSCGALVGAVMAAGLHLQGAGASRTARKLSLAFKDACGAVACKDIKGVGTGQVLCSCDDCVRNAVMIFGRIMDLN